MHSRTTMDAEYVQKIQSWVELDNRVLRNKQTIQEVVEKKKELEEEILEYIETHKFDKFTINISDGSIKFSKRNVTQPLSMRTLRTALEKYSEEKQEIDVEEILDFVADNLEVKAKYFMKRDVKP